MSRGYVARRVEDSIGAGPSKPFAHPAPALAGGSNILLTGLAARGTEEVESQDPVFPPAERHGGLRERGEHAAEEGRLSSENW